jgi:LPXTG-site transpeptidase (sortase) family protein
LPGKDVRFSRFNIGIAGIALSLVTIFFIAGGSVSKNLVKGTSVISINNSVSEEQNGTGLPIRLKIPKINVDTHIESVGLTSESEMGVPKDHVNAAWFNDGPRPGEKGNSVIDGHFGWKNNIPAAFDNLYKLKKGDKLYTVNDRGTTTTFVVRELRTYGENENATDVFGLGDGESPSQSHNVWRGLG